MECNHHHHHHDSAWTAFVWVISNTFLVILKFIVWFMTGSVSIISEAFHTCMDLISAFIGFFSIKFAKKSPDENHNYGYGKIEALYWILEWLVIFLVVWLILYESIEKIINSEPIESIWRGFWVMIISWIVNFFVSQRFLSVAKKNKSIALEADALHIRSDTYSSIGISIGLLLIWITWWQILDPIIAILVWIFIAYKARAILKKSFLILMDASLPKQDIDKIKQIILNEKDIHWVENIFSRTVWSIIFLEFDLIVEDIKISQANNIISEIIKDIKNYYPDIQTRIQLITKKNIL